MTSKEKARISIRTNPKLKEEATKVLENMQLDMSTAVNLLLDQIVKQNKLPFEITNETAEDQEERKIIAELKESMKDIDAGKGRPLADLIAETETRIGQLENEQISDNNASAG